MPPVGDRLGEGVRPDAPSSRPDDPAALRIGAGAMTLAAAAFVGYGVIFLIRNFSDSFLELGIGPEEVDVGKDQIQAFSPSLAHYISHLHLAWPGSWPPPGWRWACWPGSGCGGGTCGRSSGPWPRR